MVFLPTLRLQNRKLLVIEVGGIPGDSVRSPCCGAPKNQSGDRYAIKTYEVFLRFPTKNITVGLVPSFFPSQSTPWQIDMEHKHGGWEDDLPFQLGEF